jgi:hypothetical protein
VTLLNSLQENRLKGYIPDKIVLRHDGGSAGSLATRNRIAARVRRSGGRGDGMFSNAAMETWNRTRRDFEIVREVDHVCGAHLYIS